MGLELITVRSAFLAVKAREGVLHLIHLGGGGHMQRYFL